MFNSIYIELISVLLHKEINSLYLQCLFHLLKIQSEVCMMNPGQIYKIVKF